ncbi:growth/differentiation factor 8 [Genypterus blacodes]|uniref:growth/differentiation factor 8 n=1 Tax=Genypterus blacodes TaxID=154954 RepID=UPI003F7631B6
MLSLHCLLYCTLPLLSLCSSGDGRPHTTHAGAPNVGREDSQRALLLEAVKTGILSSLGMEREPTLTEKASDEELRKMYRLYREKMRELGGNSSLPMRETRYSAMSTVLFPATVEAGEVLWRRNHVGQQLQRFRAVFKKNPNIQTELALTRAVLKISRQILEKPTSALPEVGQEIRVKVNGKKPMNSAWTHIEALVHGNVSSTQDLTFDISPEVDKWRKNDGGQSLVVDVAVVMGKRLVVRANPTFSVEVTLMQPKPAGRKRLPRSNNEDACDERGWCCRKTVSVSFKDIGWSDWVVAPAEYLMHFCDGSCPHNYKPASMHTQVKSRLSQMTRGGMHRPCCVPSAYEGMVLMHYDSRGRLKLTPFNDLIVSKCHCA